MNLPSQQLSEVVASLRAAGNSDGSEKRRFTRMQVQAQIRLATMVGEHVARVYTALTREISAGGISFLQYSTAERGQSLVISLPRGNTSVHLLATCTSCRHVAVGLWGIGAEFQRVAPQALVDTIEQVQHDEIDQIRQSILR